MPRRAMQRRSFGSITEVRRGEKYIARWVENTDRGRRRLSKTILGSRRDASAFLARKELEHGSERRVPTIGEAYEMWYLPWLERSDLSENTRKLYDRAWKGYVAPAWADCPVDAVRPIDVQRWLLSLTKPITAPALSVVRRVVDFAVQYEAVDTNKFRERYELSKTQTFARDKTVYDFGTAERVHSLVAGTSIEAAYILAVFGSCRTGESLAPTPGDVSTVEAGGMRFAAVSIERRVKRDGTLSGPGELKTPESVRTVLVPGRYGARLVGIARERREAGFLFLSSEDGRNMTLPALKRAWANLAGDDRIPFANLRNSWRTIAQFEWGADSDTLEMLMGHRIPGTTGRHYLRPSVEQLAERLSRAPNLASLSGTWDI